MLLAKRVLTAKSKLQRQADISIACFGSETCRLRLKLAVGSAEPYTMELEHTLQALEFTGAPMTAAVVFIPPHSTVDSVLHGLGAYILRQLRVQFEAQADIMLGNTRLSDLRRGVRDAFFDPSFEDKVERLKRIDTDNATRYHLAQRLARIMESLWLAEMEQAPLTPEWEKKLPDAIRHLEELKRTETVAKTG